MTLHIVFYLFFSRHRVSQRARLGKPGLLFASIEYTKGMENWSCIQMKSGERKKIETYRRVKASLCVCRMRVSINSAFFLWLRRKLNSFLTNDNGWMRSFAFAIFLVWAQIQQRWTVNMALILILPIFENGNNGSKFILDIFIFRISSSRRRLLYFFHHCFIWNVFRSSRGYFGVWFLSPRSFFPFLIAFTTEFNF